MISCSARFFDGKSSHPHLAKLTCQVGEMLIQTSDQTHHWHQKDLWVMERPYENKPLVLGCKAYPDARLIIEDPECYAPLLRYVPQKQTRLSQVELPWRLILLGLLTIVLLLGFLIWGIPRAAPWVARMIPESWENQLGSLVVSQMTKNHEACVDPDGLSALDQLTQRLSSAQPHEPHFQVRVVDFDEINAFTAPGHQILIMKGLIDAAESPDEVAGVLAHEMAHALERHPTSGLIQALGLQVILASAFGSAPDFGSHLIHYSYSRKMENEADKIGVQLLTQAQIDPEGLIRFFETLSHHYGSESEYFSYFSTHPSTEDRMTEIKNLLTNQTYTPSLSANDWQALRNICRKKAKLN